MEDNCCGLDQILKNTEFENSQQLKSIESEKERNEAYEHRIEEIKAQLTSFDEQSLSLKEKATKLGQQHAINKDTINSLKVTSTVLAEHEDALEKKLRNSLDEVHQERLQHHSALEKYESIWATFESEYDGMEKVQQMKKKKEEFDSVKRKNNYIEKRIADMESTTRELEMTQGKEKSLASWIVHIASLRIDTNKNRSAIQACQTRMFQLQKMIKEQRKENECIRLQQEETPSFPNESAREPLLVPGFSLSSQRCLAVNMEQSSVFPLSQHREYGIHTKTSLEHRKNKPSSDGEINDCTVSAAHPKPTRHWYSLEMPKLSISSRKTQTGNEITMPPTLQISAFPKLSSLGNQGLALTQTTTPHNTVQLPMQISSSIILNPTPPPPIRQVESGGLSSLPVCSELTSTPIDTTSSAMVSLTDKNILPNLQLGSSSHNQQHDFRFKEPRGPVSVTTSQVSSPGTKAIFSQPLYVAQTVDKACSSSSNCSVQYQKSQTTIMNNCGGSNTDWSSALPVVQSTPGKAYGNQINSDPIYQGVISMPLSVSQIEQVTGVINASRDDSIQLQDMVMECSRDGSVQLEERSCNSSVDHAMVGCNVISTGLGGAFDANQPLLRTDGRDAQEFSDQQSMFGGDGGFNFGSIGQQSECGGGLGGGFGFFGDQQQQQGKQQQGSAEAESAFGSGFSFGANSSSQQSSSDALAFIIPDES